MKNRYSEQDLMLIKANAETGAVDDAYPQLVEDLIAEGHPTYGNEVALLRKEIAHIEDILSIAPTPEFHAYNLECEAKKQQAREELGYE